MKMDYNIAQHDYLGILYLPVGVLIFVQAPEAGRDSKPFVPINWIRLLLHSLPRHVCTDPTTQLAFGSSHYPYLCHMQTPPACYPKAIRSVLSLSHLWEDKYNEGNKYSGFSYWTGNAHQFEHNWVQGYKQELKSYSIVWHGSTINY